MHCKNTRSERLVKNIQPKNMKLEKLIEDNFTIRWFKTLNQFESVKLQVLLNPKHILKSLLEAFQKHQKVLKFRTQMKTYIDHICLPLCIYASQTSNNTKLNIKSQKWILEL
jgi:hypothetical protein